MPADNKEDVARPEEASRKNRVSLLSRLGSRVHQSKDFSLCRWQPETVALSPQQRQRVGEEQRGKGRCYKSGSFSNDLSVLLRVTAFQDRVSQQDA